MSRMSKVILFSILFTTCLSVAFASTDIYPFQIAKQRQRFDQLTQQLRCVVCKNQSLADSNAPLAQDLRKDIYNMIKKGDSNQQIKDFLVKRYGDFVLFKPPVNSKTYLLWFSPFILLVGALLVLLIFVKRGKGDAKTMQLSLEERERVKRLMNQDQ